MSLKIHVVAAFVALTTLAARRSVPRASLMLFRRRAAAPPGSKALEPEITTRHFCLGECAGRRPHPSNAWRTDADRASAQRSQSRH